MTTPFLIITGPTASGKSAFAFDIAKEFNGTIINADSMQIYKELPLLTACPSQKERLEVPHALYNILAHHEACSAALWREKVLLEIQEAFLQKRLPLVTGGTGFYLKALMEGISYIPPIDDDLRERTRYLSKENPSFLYEDLQKIDPHLAKRLHPHDTQRVARAWEVMKGTGQSLLYWQTLTKNKKTSLNYKTIILLPDRAHLYQKADERFEEMIKNGAIEEVKDFLAKNPSPDCPLMKALGLRQLKSYLEGEISLENAITSAKIATRQYIKRQYTWFRHQLKNAAVINNFYTQKAMQSAKKVLKELYPPFLL
jgi:tRNA dimethylallyltransferase